MNAHIAYISPFDCIAKIDAVNDIKKHYIDSMFLVFVSLRVSLIQFQYHVALDLGQK